MHVNFISSRDTGEILTHYVWSDHVSIMQGNDTYDIIREMFESFLYNYQKELKNRGGSYIKSPKWLENKKSTNKTKK